MITEYINNEKKYGKGIKNSFQIPAAKQKIKDTINKHYENGYKTLAAITRQHLLEKEGIVNVGQRKSVRYKILKKKISDKERLKKFKEQIDFFDNQKNVKSKIIKAFEENNKKKITLTELSRKYNNYFKWAEFRRNNYKWCKKYIVLTGSHSQLEKDFEKQVLQNMNIKYKVHVNNILGKQDKAIHFDFLLPDYNILIELNPTFTHHVNKIRRYNRPNRLWKFNQAKLYGYTLLNFYDNDLNSFNKCKNIINNTINKLNHGYILMTDGVPYPVKSEVNMAYDDNRHNKKQKVINNPTVYNEGYTFWKKIN